MARRFKNAFTGFDEAAVIDVETTGFSAKDDRIVEVGVARTDFSALARGETSLYFETFEARVNPGVKIPASASRVHGIYDDDVKNAKPFEEIAQQLRDFIGSRPVVGHNVSFDEKFLNAEFKRAGVTTLQGNRSYCTMLRFRELFPGEKSSLDAVAAMTGHSRRGTHHGALEDATLTGFITASFYQADNDLDDAFETPKGAGSSSVSESKSKRGRSIGMILAGIAAWMLFGNATTY